MHNNYTYFNTCTWKQTSDTVYKLRVADLSTVALYRNSAIRTPIPSKTAPMSHCPIQLQQSYTAPTKEATDFNPFDDDFIGSTPAESIQKVSKFDTIKFLWTVISSSSNHSCVLKLLVAVRPSCTVLIYGKWNPVDYTYFTLVRLCSLWSQHFNFKNGLRYLDVFV